MHSLFFVEQLIPFVTIDREQDLGEPANVSARIAKG